jgi:molybdenum cofactor cytidylyltransferase
MTTIDLLPIAYKVLQMPDKSLFAIVLAAGEARRFGSTKQLARFEGSALVALAMRCAEIICGPRTVLVVGSNWRAVATACQPLEGFMILNQEYACGMSSSIRSGILALPRQADGALLMLADQPLVTSEHLATLVQAWQSNPESIVTSAYAGTNGPPVVFPRRDFAALIKLMGDRGAKTVLDENRDRVMMIDCEPAAFDIDRPEDLDNF